MLVFSGTHLHDRRMDRWNTVLELLVNVLRGRAPQRVVVRGDEALAAMAAGRPAGALRAAGRSTVIATGAADGDVVIGCGSADWAGASRPPTSWWI